MADKTVSELIMEYFYAHPNEELEHGPVVDWVTEQWLKSHHTPPRDPWRAIRALHQKGRVSISTIPAPSESASWKISPQNKKKKFSGETIIVA